MGKGLVEACKILDGMGALSGQLVSDIDDAHQRIQDGLGDLDRRFGAATLARAGYGERFVAQAETFELTVTTRDGSPTAMAASSQSGRLQIGGLLKDLLAGGFSLDERFDPPRLDKAGSLNRSLLDGLQALLTGRLGEGAASG